MQKWKKLGLIFKPLGAQDSSSHCQPPTPFKLSEHIYRIFYASRNVHNFAQIFYFDFDLDELKVVSYSKGPILTLGKDGTFDQHGIYPSSVVDKGGQKMLYTIGYTQGRNSIYYMRIGLATSDDGKNFKKYSQVPLLNISEYEPWMLSGPFVMVENDVYRMWYVSGYKWDKGSDGELQSYYNIKYAESKDGIDWKREGLISIGLYYPNETNIARPWIIKENGIYKAWFSYCCGKQGYRIGYAESTDGGYKFERMDNLAGIHPSDELWENEAVAYPAVIVHKGKKYMFYNGNKFGKDGVALAVEE